MILHGLREEITIRPHIELPSAYHMAHYLDEFVTEKTIGITVCGRFFKQIGEKVFQGTLLYHVDRIGSHLIRGINADSGMYTVLDDSPYWNKFPYDFDQGPVDPDLPIGYHPGPELEGEGEEAKAKARATARSPTTTSRTRKSRPGPRRAARRRRW